jgi:Domain of unknown function (DUF4136)
MSNRARKQKRILYAFLLITAGGCDCNDDGPDDQVTARAKPGVDFSEYHTFRIKDDVSKDELEDAGIDIDPDKIPENVKLNIDIANDQARIELETIGLTEVDEDEDADLVIFSMGSTKDQDAIYWECVPGYWWGYWGWVWDNCAWLEPYYVNYTIGSVLLGLGDPEMQDVVFSGLVQGVEDNSGEAEERIRSGVHEMFKQYPEGPSDD